MLGPASNDGMRNCAFHRSGFSAGPAIVSVPSADPTTCIPPGGRLPLSQARKRSRSRRLKLNCTTAGIIVRQAPLAIALDHRTGQFGIEVRHQLRALCRGGQSSVAHRLVVDPHAPAGRSACRSVDAG